MILICLATLFLICGTSGSSDSEEANPIIGNVGDNSSDYSDFNKDKAPVRKNLDNIVKDFLGIADEKPNTKKPDVLVNLAFKLVKDHKPKPVQLVSVSNTIPKTTRYRKQQEIADRIKMALKILKGQSMKPAEITTPSTTTTTKLTTFSKMMQGKADQNKWAADFIKGLNFKPSFALLTTSTKSQKLASVPKKTQGTADIFKLAMNLFNGLNIKSVEFVTPSKAEQHDKLSLPSQTTPKMASTSKRTQEIADGNNFAIDFLKNLNIKFDKNIVESTTLPKKTTTTTKDSPEIVGRVIWHTPTQATTKMIYYYYSNPYTYVVYYTDEIGRIYAYHTKKFAQTLPVVWSRVTTIDPNWFNIYFTKKMIIGAAQPTGDGQDVQPWKTNKKDENKGYIGVLPWQTSRKDENKGFKGVLPWQTSKLAPLYPKYPTQGYNPENTWPSKPDWAIRQGHHKHHKHITSTSYWDRLKSNPDPTEHTRLTTPHEKKSHKHHSHNHHKYSAVSSTPYSANVALNVNIDKTKRRRKHRKHRYNNSLAWISPKQNDPLYTGSPIYNSYPESWLNKLKIYRASETTAKAEIPDAELPPSRTTEEDESDKRK